MASKVSKKDNSEDTTPEQKTSKLKVVKDFLLKHIVKVILLLLVIVVFIWSRIQISSLKSDFNQQKTEITKKYELKLDSLNIARMELTAKTFSWAVRSELQRQNKEQVELFFYDFIKSPQIEKLQYINSDNSTIELSTNKKEEGLIATSDFFKTNDQLTKSDSTSFKIATPIMGLNKKLGVVVIEVKKQ
ncbi:hypothetical protein GCM10011531_23950 [Aquaticitalea lipolytica]|uniref:Uncharacterized protein n=1 Tax=Aquaticitalea lipolytica TaxID=1247562 RepID=A0A8J2XHV6_9FLAO|nr:hypothetical protein [Aquaticitalea lipolytica]GFZ91452.1 hypothetical protein GCM10011531_23950 [Aquaticitalea lipolytica]